MNKYNLFDYEPGTLYGNNLQDALERQQTVKTPVKIRKANTDNPESVGGEELIIAQVLSVEPAQKNITRGDKHFERAIVELIDRRIIEVDAYTDQTAAAALLGSIKSARKSRSSAANGKLGGRPKKPAKAW